MKEFVILLLFCVPVLSYTRAAPKTVGQPWPLPQKIVQTSTVYNIDRNAFRFNAIINSNSAFSRNTKSCPLIYAAIDRCYLNVFGVPRETALKFNSNSYQTKNDVSVMNKASSLGSIDIHIEEECEEVPSLQMNESYTLTIDNNHASLHSSNIWGAMYGLETFSHLVYRSTDGMYHVNHTTISDWPRFAHRGVLLDSARHFLPVEIIKQSLDAMAYNKLNVFHWHIVDDQAFPYQSTDFPNLSAKGSFQPYTHTYTQGDVADIIEYARRLGIRVVPEFDSPGHTQSWGPGQPGLLTECYNAKKQFTGYGPVDPTKNSTYRFLKQFMAEISRVFPDKYIHLGGDEVSFTCWKSNQNVTDFMNKMGFNSSYAKLEEYYEQKLLNIVSDLKKGYIVWQEVVDNGVKVSPDTVVHVWLGKDMEELAKVTKMGLRAILSSCWYLNYISYGNDWTKYYACEPQNFEGTDEQKALVMGGELCMWGEFVDATNVLTRTWPRGSAVAERLWSHRNVTDSKVAAPRLEEHRCRMIGRGLQVEPVMGPGFCDHEYVPRG